MQGDDVGPSQRVLEGEGDEALGSDVCARYPGVDDQYVADEALEAVGNRSPDGAETHHDNGKS